MAGAGATAGIGGTCGAAPATTWVTDWRATRTRTPSRSTSISLRPVSSMSFASSRIRSCSLTCPASSDLFRFGANHAGQSLNSQRIALDAEPADHRLRTLGDVGVMAEFLALMNVGDVDFDG